MKYLFVIFTVLMTTGSSHAWVPLCVDVGHGGTDPGAKVYTTLDNDYWEKDLALEIALLLQDSLLPQYEYPTSVYFTRLTDYFLQLVKRANIADSVYADAFISIHFNSSDNHDAQYILTTYCNSDTVCDGGMYPGEYRSTDSVLATKIGLRLRDQIETWSLQETSPWAMNYIILRCSKMPSTLIEPCFISCYSTADSLYENTGNIRDKIVSAIYHGWRSWVRGQGIALVDYEYENKEPFDCNYVPIEVEITLGFWADPNVYCVPYKGCWEESERVILNAIEFTKEIGGEDWPYTFHHWEWRDFNPDTIIASYASNPYDFFVMPSFYDSTHYWVAYFTGGPFYVTWLLPSFYDTVLRPNDSVELIWNAPAGARETCSLYVDYSINNGQIWSPIIGPIPYDYNPFIRKDNLDMMTSVYNWLTPDVTAENCFIRYIAYDAADNKDTLISHKFSLNCCIGDRGNTNCSNLEEPDISDINRIIDFLYLSHDPLCCFEEADVCVSGEIDISDISYLVDYLYQSHTPLPACP